jgi:hypothetical protein
MVLQNPERLYVEGMYICICVICIHHVNDMVNTVKFTKGDGDFIFKYIIEVYGLDGRGIGVRVLVIVRLFCSPRRPERFWGSTNGYRRKAAGP